MSRYEPRIRKSPDGDFFALIVRVDSDGEESVINTYKGRYFSTLQAAQKSTAAHIQKILNPIMSGHQVSPTR